MKQSRPIVWSRSKYYYYVVIMMLHLETKKLKKKTEYYRRYVTCKAVPQAQVMLFDDLRPLKIT